MLYNSGLKDTPSNSFSQRGKQNNPTTNLRTESNKNADPKFNVTITKVVYAQTGNFATFVIREQIHASNHMNFWTKQTDKMWEQPSGQMSFYKLKYLLRFKGVHISHCVRTMSWILGHTMSTSDSAVSVSNLALSHPVGSNSVSRENRTDTHTAMFLKP